MKISQNQKPVYPWIVEILDTRTNTWHEVDSEPTEEAANKNAVQSQGTTGLEYRFRERPKV